MARRLPPRYTSGPKKGQFRKRGGSTARKSKRRRRRNPGGSTFPYAYSRPRSNPRRRRSSGFKGIRLGKKIVFPAVPRLVSGVGGIAATRVVPAYISRMFPLPSPWVGTALQAAVAIVGGSLLGNFTKRQYGEDFALCGLAMMADDLAQTFVYPQIGLGAYVGDSGVGAYLDQYLQPGAVTSGTLTAGSSDYGSAGLPERLSTRARL